MAIFGDGLNPKEECTLQISEIETRLAKYNVSKNDIDAITEMVSDTYAKLESKEEIHADFMEVLAEDFGNEFLDRVSSKALMRRTNKIMNLLMEDEDTLPFEDEDDEDDGNGWN